MAKDSKNVETLSVTNSSVIDEVGYDSVSQDLFVRFKGGKVYMYLDVPPDIFGKFKTLVQNQESVGKFFSKNVRGKFSSMPV